MVHGREGRSEEEDGQTAANQAQNIADVCPVDAKDVDDDDHCDEKTDGKSYLEWINMDIFSTDS